MKDILSLICFVFSLWNNLNLVSSNSGKLTTIVVGGDDDPIAAGLELSTPSGPVYNVNSGNFKAYLDSPTKVIAKSTNPPKYVTETVYGFLDFVTTIGSTVMVFTPQEENHIPPIKKVKPSPTLTKVVATKAPDDPFLTRHRPKPKERKARPETAPASHSVSPNPKAKASKDPNSGSSKSSPTGLAALLRKALLDSQGKKNDRKPSFSSRPFRNSFKNGDPRETKRPALSTIGRKNHPSGGGSTIIPITVEGRGGPLPTRVVEVKPTEVPKEVVVTAQQVFPPIKAIGPFTTEVNNAIESDYHYDHLIAQSSPTVTEAFSLFAVSPASLRPERKVVYTASAIEVNSIDRFDPILKSSIPPFSISPVHSLKSVIEGSSTEFFRPDSTVILPLESLFSSEVSRDPRNNGDPLFGRPKLSKRRGSGSFIREDPSYYQSENDQFYDDDTYDYDLQRSGSDPKPSFNRQHNSHPISPTPASAYHKKPSIYRDRFRATGTRNSPPPLLRRRPVEKLSTSNRFRLGISQRPKLVTDRRQTAPLQRTKKKVVKINEQPESIDINNEERLAFEDGNIVSFNPTEGVQLQESPLEHKVMEQKNDPLFENILDTPRKISTLPPIDLKGNNLNAMLSTLTETYRTTETVFQTSVLPVKKLTEMNYHTLTQTYLITRVVSAIKTMPPVEAFEFIPGNSLNEFNDKLLAEGTEHEHDLLPGEQELHENAETRVNPPFEFLEEGDLADLAGGKFNPGVLEKQMHPELAAVLSSHKETPELQPKAPEAHPKLPGLANLPTPNLSPEQLQMAYLRLINPYLFGALSPALPGAPVTVTSTPVVRETEVTVTVSRTFPIQFNDRRIITTLTSLSVVRTTTTIYETQSATLAPGIGFPYPQPLAYATG